MERSLMKEVNKVSIGVRLTTENIHTMMFPNFFDVKKVQSLDFETLVGTKGVPVMADIIGWDAPAPIKTRDTISKILGEIPKTAVKRTLRESEVLKYIDLKNKARDDGDKKALLDLAFNDFDFCYNAVAAKMEYLSLQAMSMGQISLTNTNNAAGIKTKVAVDYQVPTANKFGAEVVWSSASTAKPIDDIESVVESASDNGITINYVLMRKDTFKQLKNADDTKTKISSWVNGSGNLQVTKATINEYLKANDLPPIVIIESTVKHESKSHSRTTLKSWAANRVSFVTSLKQGDIQHGPIAAEYSDTITKYATLVKQGFTLITKWSDLEPYSEFTKAEANAFPVINAPDELYLLRTDSTSW